MLNNYYSQNTFYCPLYLKSTITFDELTKYSSNQLSLLQSSIQLLSSLQNVTFVNLEHGQIDLLRKIETICIGLTPFPAAQSPPRSPIAGSILKAEDEKTQHKNKVIVLIPIGIPGMGKSSFIQQTLESLQTEKHLALNVVSSDKIRKETIDAFLHSHPEKSQKEALSSTSRETAEVFHSQVKDAF